MSSLSAAVVSNPTIRVLGVITLLTEESPRKPTASEIGKTLNIPKSTCSIILSELCASRYLIREHATSRIGLGLRVAEAAQAARRGQERISKLIENQESLHQELKLPLSIIQRGRRSTVVVSSVSPQNPLMRTGSRRPMHAPLGACFTAFSPPADQASWIANAQRIEGTARASLRIDLLRKLKLIEEIGFEINLATSVESAFFSYQNKLTRSGDLIAVDADTHLYRRNLLESNFLPDALSETRDYDVARLVIPVQNQESKTEACLELWTGGGSFNGKALVKLYQHTRQVINKYIK